MPQPDFDFWAGFWKALLGEDGARELAQHFLDMGPEARAELEMFQGHDPAEVARTLTARAAPAPPPRSSPRFRPQPTVSLWRADSPARQYHRLSRRRSDGVASVTLEGGRGMRAAHITPGHVRAFQGITSQLYDNIVLWSCTIKGEPGVAILIDNRAGECSSPSRWGWTSGFRRNSPPPAAGAGRSARSRGTSPSMPKSRPGRVRRDLCGAGRAGFGWRGSSLSPEIILLKISHGGAGV